mgnify:CR=1 FL=1
MPHSIIIIRWRRSPTEKRPDANLKRSKIASYANRNPLKMPLLRTEVATANMTAAMSNFTSLERHLPARSSKNADE